MGSYISSRLQLAYKMTSMASWLVLGNHQNTTVSIKTLSSYTETVFTNNLRKYEHPVLFFLTWNDTNQ